MPSLLQIYQTNHSQHKPISVCFCYSVFAFINSADTSSILANQCHQRANINRLELTQFKTVVSGHDEAFILCFAKQHSINVSHGGCNENTERLQMLKKALNMRDGKLTF